MDDRAFREVLHFFQLSWDGYRRVRRGVRKRLARHMLELGCRSVRDYLDTLQNDPLCHETARRLLAVTISRFFRDTQCWEVVDRWVLPDLATSRDIPVRIWSAGCGCGEEAYSFKILWDRWIRGLPVPIPLQILATDMNPEVLERARAGFYPAGSLKEVGPALRSEYFRPAPGGYSIADELKSGIHWSIHDYLTDEPPAMKFHVVFLRNGLLTYYGLEVKGPAFHRVAERVNPGGYLIVGNNEELPVKEGEFERCTPSRCVFQRI